MADSTTSVASAGASAAGRHQTVHRRTPVDLRRLALFAAVLALGVALATGLDETMAGIESDLLQGLARVPASIAGLVLSLVSVAYLALMLGAPVVLAVTRRWRTLGVGALGILITSLAFGWVQDAVPVRTAELPERTTTAFAGQSAWPLSSALAVYTALAVIAAVELPRRWQQAVWSLLGVLAVLRVLTASELPLDVVLAVGVGGVVGAGLLLAFGRSVRVASAAGVLAALQEAGLDVGTIEPLDRTLGSWEYRADTATGPVRAKVVGWESQQLDALYRAYRRVRLRDVGDDTAYSSARRAVAVESLLSVYGGLAGVRTPAVRALVPLGGDDVVLAVDEVAGTSLRSLDDTEITDDVLRQCWAQVAAMRAARIAHRDLELGRFVLDTEGRVWLVDFGFGQPAADDQVMSGDVAELLAATYVRVGAERAVAAAVSVLGTEPLAEALMRLVPAALSSETRAALKAVPDGAAPLVDELCRVTGVAEPQLAKVERLKPQYLVIGALLGVAVYFLLPQLTDVPRMIETVREADWVWVAPALLASALTYLGIALAMSGATPGRTSFSEMTAVQVATSFVATFAPPGIGQLGLNLRHLQKRGFAGPVAVSVIASKEAVVLIVHVLMLGIVAVWAGRDGALDEELERLPSGPTALLIGAVLLVAIGLTLMVPRVRALLTEKVVPAVQHSVQAMATVARNPVKISMLFGGITLFSVGYAACLYFSLQAFGAGASYAAIALVYLTAGTVASAAPTPGGVGAVEAILLAALTGIGIASPTALAGVFLYRLATFWLPILPGFVAFRWLTARDAI